MDRGYNLVNNELLGNPDAKTYLPFPAPAPANWAR